MTEQLALSHERVDDMPLLLAQLDRMQVAKLLDECFPTHGNWQGLSLGQVVSVWVTFILSEANYRMSHVEPWAERRWQTLNTCLGTGLWDGATRARRPTGEGYRLAGSGTARASVGVWLPLPGADRVQQTVRAVADARQ